MRHTSLTPLSRVGGTLIVAVLASGCTNLGVLSSRCDSVVVTTDGETDYAVKYTVRTRNNGVDGKVRAEGRVEIPSGTYYRDEVINIGSEEERTFEFIFTEVTIGDVILSDSNGIRCHFSYDVVS